MKDKQFLGVTYNNTADSLEKTLRQELLDKGKSVVVVNMDMSKLIRGVVARVFPETPIVVDKFHVIKYTNHVIDLCRIAVEKTVQEKFEIKRLLVMKTETFEKIRHKPKWQYRVQQFECALKEHPEIKVLWDLKNKLHGFYRCENLLTAHKAWRNILNFLNKYRSIHPELADLKKTFLNWKTGILNYFIYRTTNAFIEGLNNRIETLKRKKFGFRSKAKFIKALLYMLLPISDIFLHTIFTHYS